MGGMRARVDRQVLKINGVDLVGKHALTSASWDGTYSFCACRWVRQGVGQSERASTVSTSRMRCKKYLIGVFRRSPNLPAGG